MKNLIAFSLLVAASVPSFAGSGFAQLDVEHPLPPLACDTGYAPLTTDIVFFCEEAAVRAKGYQAMSQIDCFRKASVDPSVNVQACQQKKINSWVHHLTRIQCWEPLCLNREQVLRESEAPIDALGREFYCDSTSGRSLGDDGDAWAPATPEAMECQNTVAMIGRDLARRLIQLRMGYWRQLNAGECTDQWDNHELQRFHNRISRKTADAAACPVCVKNAIVDWDLRLQAYVRASTGAMLCSDKSYPQQRPIPPVPTKIATPIPTATP